MSIRPKDRFLTFRRDNFTCQYCGRKPPEIKLECDHIIPQAKGGRDHIINYITACRECNIGKGIDVADFPRRERGLKMSGLSCDDCGKLIPCGEVEGWDSDTFCKSCALKYYTVAEGGTKDV